MKQFNSTQFCIALFALLLSAESAQAQLFGSRSVGSPLRSRTSPISNMSNQESTGQLQGTERFVRGNRSRNDFVGSDRGELSGFVGSQQAIGVGRVRTTAEDFRVESANTRNMNRAMPAQPTKGMYYPRLKMPSIEVARRTDRNILLQPKLIARVHRMLGEGVNVRVQDRVAILDGTANSPEKLKLLQTILLLEAGIDEVRAAGLTAESSK
ncbi:MAG: hypothetical protein AAF394_19475 [Planctomycetota bacterium]